MPTSYHIPEVEDESLLFVNKSEEEKKEIIPKMVEYAQEWTIKKTARMFYTTPKTVRYYLKKYGVYEDIKNNKQNKID